MIRYVRTQLSPERYDVYMDANRIGHLEMRHNLLIGFDEDASHVLVTAGTLGDDVMTDGECQERLSMVCAAYYFHAGKIADGPFEIVA